MNDMQERELMNKWFAMAKRKIISAEEETDDFGKRFIAHGAMNLFNCAQQLKKLIETKDNSLSLKLQKLKKDRKCP